MQAQGAGTWPFGGPFTYIEDVFSTWLYTGTSATQTITNNIDLSGNGGLVWTKCRGTTARNHVLIDTARGASSYLASNLTDAAASTSVYITGFNNNGYGIGTGNAVNASPNTFASWTFRKQAKFFDVVTYTGDGTSSRNISHSLASVPGCIIVKRTDDTSNWPVQHQSLAGNQFLYLNTTAAVGSIAASSTTTSTTFQVGTSLVFPNASGGTYVAYLFAHNAGGFGLTGTDNVISCGSFTSTTAGTTVTLGYEPQYLMMKPSSSTGDWIIVDNMRGFNVTTDQSLYANTSDAEVSYDWANPTATGFIEKNNNNGVTYIYIAIRRGPMKTPTSGTSVLGLNARTGTGANATVTGGQTDDAVLIKNRGSAVASLFSSRLTGTGYLVTSSTAAEVAAGTTILQANPWDVMDGVKVGTTSTITNASANTYINYLFRRAPGFFDVVCFTATGSTFSVTHNLGVAPELVITKEINGANAWYTYSATYGYQYYLSLNGINAKAGPTAFFGTGNPTSTTLSLSGGTSFFSSGQNYVAYLFASCPGVSKVGSYTGTGALQTINCGFTSGARFVLIKRTDSTGDWYVWDSARGIVAGNDPYLLLNVTAAEVTSTDYVDTYSAGFEISSTAPAAINANGGTYIFLAIA
jgi:hypothetical protein